MMKEIPDSSIESLITDPPAGIAFMGKDWDSDKGGRDNWIEWMQTVMVECLRVLKPGAHGFVWAIPRTSHWTATALENAGFEVRDIITHLFGSGFPKSHNISRAIDKKFGVERKTSYIPNLENQVFGKGKCKARGVDRTPGVDLSEPPKTPQAKQWDGFGTALKPASENWILVRKPLKGTVCDNVLKHGVGGINIDECRVEFEGEKDQGRVMSPVDGTQGYKHHAGAMTGMIKRMDIGNDKGRFPANLVLSHHDDCEHVGFKDVKGIQKWKCHRDCTVKMLGEPSRFFYCAKASKSERNKGLEELQNKHPTVKAKILMQYLITLITPQGGTVLDPFMGSGSTGVAALELGFSFTGIEKEQDYFEMAQIRIKGTIPLHTGDTDGS